MFAQYKKSAPLVILMLLAFLSVVIWAIILFNNKNNELRVAFLDVGQGDAIFIETPSGRQILIDGGRDSRVLQELAAVMPFWDRSIDIVMATHPDADHINGLIEVFNRYDVKTFVYPGTRSDTEESQALHRAVASEQPNSILAQRGQVYDFGDNVRIDILFPDRDVADLEPNVGSIIAKVVFGEHSFLLTGDSPKMIEEYLLSLSTEEVQSTVLKAGHHGSKTSSSPVFVGFVDPEYAVMSRGCGNSYGHPHQEVLDTYASFGVSVRDTCIDGRITFISDGQTMQVR